MRQICISFLILEKSILLDQQRRGRQGDIPELGVDFDDEEIFADSSEERDFVFPKDEKIDAIDTETTIEPQPRQTSTTSSSIAVITSTTSSQNPLTTAVTLSLPSSTTTVTSISSTTTSEGGTEVRPRIGPGYSSEEGEDNEAVSNLGPRALSFCLPLTRTECGLMGDKTVWRNLLVFIEVNDLFEQVNSILSLLNRLEM